MHGLLALLCFALLFFLLTVHGWILSNFILLHQIFRLYKKRKRNKKPTLIYFRVYSCKWKICCGFCRLKDTASILVNLEVKKIGKALRLLFAERLPGGYYLLGCLLFSGFFVWVHICLLLFIFCCHLFSSVCFHHRLVCWWINLGKSLFVVMINKTAAGLKEWRNCCCCCNLLGCNLL